MRDINQAHIEALLRLVNKGPYFQLLNMEVCTLKQGYSRIAVQLEEKHLNPFGVVHGGAYASIIDTAAYWAAYCEVDEDAGYSDNIKLYILDILYNYDAQKYAILIILQKSVDGKQYLCYHYVRQQRIKK